MTSSKDKIDTSVFSDDFEESDLDDVPLTMDSLKQVGEMEYDAVAGEPDGNDNEVDVEALVEPQEADSNPEDSDAVNFAQEGTGEPTEGEDEGQWIPNSEFTDFLMGNLDLEELENFGEDAFGGAGDSDELGESAEDWEILSWGIEPGRDEDGKLLKGEAARANPGNLVIYGNDGEALHSILLTPQVRHDLHTALTQLGKLYADPVPVSKTAKGYFDDIVQWHLDHKVLGSVSALFILAFFVFVVIGFITVI